MVFSSVIFLCIFLPATLLGYYILPHKARNFFLLVASLIFYAWGGPKHLIYLLASILFNYFSGIVISKTPGNAKKAVLAAAVCVNVASLLYFKYTGLLIETANGLFKSTIHVPEIILPLGISFYTFQCMSYIIDVYRTGSVETDPVKYALYISMFPQLLQGPIIRYSDVKETLDSPKITADDFAKGIERFIIGLFKKAVIANTLGEVCDQIFEISPQNISPVIAWLGAILYTLQLYFDFSGYTDMAIGIGRFFGFGFRENFNYPYISKSITEFWRRWHITLSNWFRDYLYIPLGGNRTGNVYVNLLIVFLATGIWHGAAWSYLVWGLWHGLFMLLERALRGKTLPFRIPAAFVSAFRWGYTMIAVTLGWVLFKIEDLPEAFSYIKAMFGFGPHDYNAFSLGFFLDSRLAFFLVIALLCCVPWGEVLPRIISSRIAFICDSNKPLPRTARHICLMVLLVISFVFIVNSTYSPFIYFRF